ncbi:MAG: nucleotidyltransferase domain-containing protein [Candidatus Methylumidiphilus sp.]
MQTQTIRQTVTAVLGQEAEIVLFGSRVDESARGGDVDLLVTVRQAPVNPAYTAAFLAAKLERALEGRKVDVVLRAPGSPFRPIHEIALRTGVAL